MYATHESARARRLQQYMRERLQTLPPQQRHDFELWLVAAAESNELEGRHETAATIRELIPHVREAMGSLT